MEGEIKNYIVVWITVLASICYSHGIGKFIPKGAPRLVTILPIVCLFLYLPLNLFSIHFGVTTTFFISFLANFKLLLFAFGKGPLSSNPPIPLSRFITIACLPIKIQNHQTIQKTHKSPLNYAIKVTLLSALMRVYRYGDYLNPKFIMLLYCFHIYLSAELVLAAVGALVRVLGRLELEPQFDEPYLSSSLQDFWGKRWNLMVTGILHPTVYDPVRSIFAPLIGRKWGSFLAVLATFFVSAMMHELMLYNVGRVKPTWEITCFFLIHGLCLAIEIVIKKGVNGKFRLPPIVSGPFVLVFVVVTGIWLFIPPALRCDADVRVRKELVAFVEFVKDAGKSVNLHPLME